MQSWNHTSHFKSHLLLIWNFQMRLEMRCATWNFLNPFETFETWNLWNEMCYLKLLKLSNLSQEFLIWNFQMRLEMRCATCIWNFLKPENFPTHHRICLFETFRWDLKWHVLFETFETHYEGCLFETFRWNLDKKCAIWNYWNLLKLTGGYLFETFRWDLKQDMLFEMFETWNFSNISYHVSSLFETFRWNLKKIAP